MKATTPLHSSGPLYGCDRAELEAMRSKSCELRESRSTLDSVRRRVLRFMLDHPEPRSINQLSVGMCTRKEAIRQAVGTLTYTGYLERAGTIKEPYPTGGKHRQAAAYQTTEKGRRAALK